MKRIYLDHSATTPIFPEAIAAMSCYMEECFGNPSSAHSFGEDARQHLEQARSQVAALISAPKEQVYFTSGGTEADNIAIFGLAEHARKAGKNHIITSAVEHHAVLDACREMETRGFGLTVLPVDEYGMVTVDILREAIRDDTFLVSVMHVNNEVGTINPITELATIVHDADALFHVDAVQSVGKIPCDITELGVDMLSYSSHKINGPKGVGALYVREGIELKRQVFGGGQEKQLRSGTENMPGIVGFAKAAEITAQYWQELAKDWQQLRDSFSGQILETIPRTNLNGHPTARAPHIANISFKYIESEALLMYLDLNGVAASAGSACSSGNNGPSHVLTAMGLGESSLSGALRFSFGLGLDQEQIKQVVAILRDKVSLLRKASPFYEEV